MPLLSILVPALDEEENLPALYERLRPVIRELGSEVECEVIILDNGSTDGTGRVAKELCRRDPAWRYVRYSRNFGYHGSLACGFDIARGDALVVLAADLQEPPELLPKMVSMWKEGADVVYGVLKARNDDNWLKTLGARLFYRIFSWLSDWEIPPYATDYRVLDRRVVDAVRAMREPDRYLRGLVHWTGFHQVPFNYDREPRRAGDSTGVWDSTAWAFNAIVSFSHKPLRAASLFGVIVMLGAALLGAYFAWIRFFPPSFMPVPPTGTTAIALLLLFGIGLNALFLGIIGEYVGRIYNQGKQRPLYIIDETVNFPPGETPPKIDAPAQRGAR